jgi:hypothetical protein
VNDALIIDENGGGYATASYGVEQYRFNFDSTDSATPAAVQISISARAVLGGVGGA